ncbi:MAG: hypothetical protein CL607_26500 [Anaerolineaceae bacterium]|nr:hypothetical protein [Anaerolineaceae bacterium]
MQNFPLVKWAMRHPRLAAWIVLSVGMIFMLAVVASNVGLAIGQWIALIVACVLVAGLCIWIISWEDEEDDLPEAAEEASVSDPAA